MSTDRYQHPKTAPRPTTVLHEILNKAKLSPTSRAKYRIVLDQWIQFAGTDPNGWTRVRMEAWRDSLIAREMSQNGVTTYVSQPRHVSKWYAITYGAVDFAHIQPIDIPTAPPRDTQLPTYDQTKRLLETCIDGKLTLYNHRDLVLMIVGFETGLRRDGLSHMLWERIGNLSIGPSGPYPSADVPVKGPRGKKRLKVPLSDLALDALESWRRQLDTNQGFVFRRLIRAQRRDGSTYEKITAQGLSGTSIYNIFEKRGKQAGLKMYPHLVRHAFVTWRVLEHVDPWVIGSVTGHSMESILKARVGKIERYLDPEKAGEQGRKTTPKWFDQIARRVLKEFS